MYHYYYYYYYCYYYYYYYTKIPATRYIVPGTYKIFVCFFLPWRLTPTTRPEPEP